ncbi:hypothetical protein AGOR_G00212550 [Albula goreensis]|uniref:Uncharacterized protein n=1 Tax=Albula goreensis TaxID=1534307 RepID=A0A8T3CRD2_9TELE|nr:hypothetical protein AGOR_G00212550 [Albula goreensis]
MRLFVVLALVAFAGCHASVMRSDEPEERLGDVISDTFWEYFDKAKQTAQDALQKIRETELGQEVHTKLSDGADVARQYAVIVQDQVTVLGQETFATVQTKLKPYAEELKKKVDELDLGQNLLPLAALQTEVLEKSQAIKQSLAPYVEDLKERMEPYTQDFTAQITALWEAFTKRD